MKNYKRKQFVTLHDYLVPIDNIELVDMSDFDNDHVVVKTHNGTYHAYGFDAIEVVLAVKPSAVEGRRNVRFKKGAWAFHNIIGHPLMQILVWIGFKKAAIRVHDITTPTARRLK